MIDYRGLPWLPEAPGRKVAGANRPVSIPWAQGPPWPPSFGFVLVSFTSRFTSILTDITSKFADDRRIDRM